MPFCLCECVRASCTRCRYWVPTSPVWRVREEGTAQKAGDSLAVTRCICSDGRRVLAPQRGARLLLGALKRIEKQVLGPGAEHRTGTNGVFVAPTPTAGNAQMKCHHGLLPNRCLCNKTFCLFRP